MTAAGGPSVFTIGLGFRQGVSAAQIEAAIRIALDLLLLPSKPLPSGARPIKALPTPALPLDSSPLDALLLSTGADCLIKRDVVPATASKPLRDCIAYLASLDVKSNEPGLLAFCAEQQIGLKCFSRETLARLPGPSPASVAVQERFGLAGICESAALAGMPEGTLLLRKTSTCGVSIAIVGIGVHDDR
jgi:cobalamin biosynthesis protein CbiG